MTFDAILNYFSGKKVLVTGGTGLIGRQVVEILCDAGAIVTSVSMDNLAIDRRVQYINANLSYFDKCLDITHDMDCVFHLAGIKGSIDITKKCPATFLVPMLQMNTNILEACRINNVQKVIYTSSIGAYSSADVFVESDDYASLPMDEFPGWAKRMAEQQILADIIQYGLDYAAVRLANVYGPGDNFDSQNAMVIPSLISRIYGGEQPVMIWGDGSAIRDFAYSKDIAEGIIRAMYYGTDSKYVNLGGGNEYSICELVKTLRDIVDFDYKFDTSKYSGYPKRVMDISVAKSTLGYNPSTALRDGIKMTCDWFVSHKCEYLEKKNYFCETN